MVFLSNDYCKLALSMWSERDDDRPRYEAFEPSLTERRRLRRLLYRWQIYYNLFGRDHEGSYRSCLNARSEDWKVGHFLVMFSIWEIEEIAPVKNYAFERYRELITGERYRKNLVSSWGTNKSDAPSINCFTKASYDDYVNLGPSFLYQFLSTSSRDKRLGLLVANARGTTPQMCLEDLSTSLREPEFAIWHGEGGDSCTNRDPDPEDLHFKGDNFETSLNAGWMVIQSDIPGMHSDEGNRLRRMLDRAIWDLERFCIGGIFDVGS